MDSFLSHRACTHALSRAHAYLTCTRSCFILCTRINMYMRTCCVQRTSASCIYTLFLPPPPSPSVRPPPVPRLPRITIDLHTNIPGISMGGMFISKSTWKFLPPYLRPLVFRKHASNTPLKRAGLSFRCPTGKRNASVPFNPMEINRWGISLERVCLLLVPNA